MFFDVQRLTNMVINDAKVVTTNVRFGVIDGDATEKGKSSKRKPVKR